MNNLGNLLTLRSKSHQEPSPNSIGSTSASIFKTKRAKRDANLVKHLVDFLIVGPVVSHCFRFPFLKKKLGLTNNTDLSYLLVSVSKVGRI